MWERELRPVCYVRSRAARSPRDAPLRTCVAGLLRLELVLHPGLVHDNVASGIPAPDALALQLTRWYLISVAACGHPLMKVLSCVVEILCK